MTGVLRNVPVGIPRLTFRISRYGVNANALLLHNCARLVVDTTSLGIALLPGGKEGSPDMSRFYNAPSQTRGAINLPDKEFRSVNLNCFQKSRTLS